MKTISVEIKGISALLMHSFPLEPIQGLDKMTKEEQAEHCTYRRPDTNALYIPGVNIQRGLVSAAAFSKGKGRASLMKIAAAVMLIQDTYCDIRPQTYVVDSRPVVNPSTKGRIVRHRPSFKDWAVNFTIEYDETLLTAIQVRKIVDDLGQRVGLLDYRPEKTGPFGRFMVTQWRV